MNKQEITSLIEDITTNEILGSSECNNCPYYSKDYDYQSVECLKDDFFRP